MLRAFAILLLFQCLGEGLSYALNLPVPGPVIGMVLLFVFLVLRPTAVDAIESTAFELLRHLSLLFVPAGVGIMALAGTIRGEWLALTVAVVVSTMLTIVVTAVVTRALLNWQHRRREVQA